MGAPGPKSCPVDKLQPTVAMCARPERSQISGNVTLAQTDPTRDELFALTKHSMNH